MWLLTGFADVAEEAGERGLQFEHRLPVDEVDLDGLAARTHDGRFRRGPQHRLNVIEHLRKLGRLRRVEAVGQWRGGRMPQRRPDLVDVLDHVRLPRQLLDSVGELPAAGAAEGGHSLRDLGDAAVDVAAGPEEQK